MWTSAAQIRTCALRRAPFFKAASGRRRKPWCDDDAPPRVSDSPGTLSNVILRAAVAQLIGEIISNATFFPATAAQEIDIHLAEKHHFSGVLKVTLCAKRTPLIAEKSFKN